MSRLYPDARLGPRPIDPDLLAQRPDYAQRLVLARLARGMTCEQVATAAGMLVAQLSEYERGLHRPGPIVQARLDRALGIEP